MTRSVVREAQILDVAAVMAVMDAAFDPRFGEAWTAPQVGSLFALPGTRVALAEWDGRIAGFYAARIVAPESELLLVAVHPDTRGQGLGRRLINDWINWASDNGVNEYFLEMRADNPAVHLYHSFDFIECGRRPNYYCGDNGQFRDAITMRKTVRNCD